MIRRTVRRLYDFADDRGWPWLALMFVCLAIAVAGFAIAAHGGMAETVTVTCP